MEKYLVGVGVGVIIILTFAAIFGIIGTILHYRRTTPNSGRNNDGATETVNQAEETNRELERTVEEQRNVIAEIRKQKIDN